MILGCQDQQAREQNLKLQEELAALKAQQNKGGDDWAKVLLARNGDGDFERKFTTFRDDMRAELEKISVAIKDTRSDNSKQFDDLDSRVRKVGDMEASLGSLKAMIEALEGKVKSVDPNEVLKLHKDLYAREFELANEKKALQAAQNELEGLKVLLAKAQQDVEAGKAELEGLKGEDISRHPQYRELKSRLVEAEAERDRARTDYAALKTQYDELEKLLRGKGEPAAAADVEALKPENYDFTGGVTSITKPSAKSQSILLVEVKTGRIPPLNSELIVLDSEGKKVCLVMVTRHFHLGGNADLPVDELGCNTIDENPTRPVTKGDTVVWKEAKKDDEPKGSAGGE
jgi:hypothetical protein